ncbi:MAG TPA: DUF3883 domain-containing protein [Bryobacteraceae bacterium]|nr:DUF3883 domain-containing protein [Bryobacteraceae bacterium]
MFRRVLFARIGWMTWYDGSRAGDERPVRGGSWNSQGVGSELCNFKRIDTPAGPVVYGFAITPGSDDAGVRPIKLERIDPVAEGHDRLDRVTVIFVASDPTARAGKRQRIVGWYTNATVLRRWKDDPTGKREGCFYNMISRAERADEAVLVPVARRQYVVPKSTTGAMGQANVWYPYGPDGVLRNPRWLKSALEYVVAYDHTRDNLLVNRMTQPTDASGELTRAGGFQPNTAIREAIEHRAMRVVKRIYTQAGYKVEDHHRTKPYDFLCVRESERRYVEVKGTTSYGEQIPVTEGEVEWVATADAPVDLCVVRCIKVHEVNKPKATGGEAIVYKAWDPRKHDLRPVSYLCRLSKAFAATV